MGAGLLFAALYKEKPTDYALLASNQYNAQRLYEFLLNFLSEDEVVFFPADELLRAESLSSSRELLSQRLYGTISYYGRTRKSLSPIQAPCSAFCPIRNGSPRRRPWSRKGRALI